MYYADRLMELPSGVLGVALGTSVNLPMALAQKVHAMTADASQALGPAADHTELYKFVGRA